jgi:hypothetical protein
MKPLVVIDTVLLHMLQVTIYFLMAPQPAARANPTTHTHNKYNTRRAGIGQPNSKIPEKPSHQIPKLSYPETG